MLQAVREQIQANATTLQQMDELLEAAVARLASEAVDEAQRVILQNTIARLRAEREKLLAINRGLRGLYQRMLQDSDFLLNQADLIAGFVDNSAEWTVAQAQAAADAVEQLPKTVTQTGTRVRSGASSATQRVRRAASRGGDIAREAIIAGTETVVKKGAKAVQGVATVTQAATSPAGKKVLSRAAVTAGAAVLAGTVAKKLIKRGRSRATIVLYASADYAYFVEEGTKNMSAQPFLRPALNAIGDSGKPEELAAQAKALARQNAPVDSGTLRGSISVSVEKGTVFGSVGSIKVDYVNGAARAKKIIETGAVATEGKKKGLARILGPSQGSKALQAPPLGQPEWSNAAAAPVLASTLRRHERRYDRAKSAIPSDALDGTNIYFTRTTDTAEQLRLAGKVDQAFQNAPSELASVSRGVFLDRRPKFLQADTLAEASTISRHQVIYNAEKILDTDVGIGTVRHESAHVMDGVVGDTNKGLILKHSDSDAYRQAQEADAEHLREMFDIPEGSIGTADPDLVGSAGWPTHLGDEAVNGYGATDPAEDFAESVRMHWGSEKEGQTLIEIDGDEYTFSELFPNRAAYMEENIWK